MCGGGYPPTPNLQTNFLSAGWCRRSSRRQRNISWRDEIFYVIKSYWNSSSSELYPIRCWGKLCWLISCFIVTEYPACFARLTEYSRASRPAFFHLAVCARNSSRLCWTNKPHYHCCHFHTLFWVRHEHGKQLQ